MNKKNFSKLVILNAILCCSWSLLFGMEDKAIKVKPRIAIDYSNIDWAKLQVLPYDMKKEILNYVFNDPVIAQLEKSINNGHIVTNKKLEMLIEIYNLKKVNKAFNQFLLKNYSEQLKKISNTLAKELILIIEYESSNIDLAKKLIQADIDINLQDKDGQTALMKASKEGHKEIVELLIKVGANLNLQDRFGETALIIASISDHKVIVELLINAGANLNLQENAGYTALSKAAYWGNKEILELLISAKANLDLSNKNGKTALIWASINGRKEIVELLIKAGANLNLYDEKGRTALDLAENDETKGILESAIKSNKIMKMKK